MTQEPALAIVKNLVRRAPELPPLVAYAVPPVVVVVTAVLAALALRRLVPRTFAVIAGGRVPKAAGLTMREAPAPNPSE